MYVYVLTLSGMQTLAVFSDEHHAIDTVKASHTEKLSFRVWREDNRTYVTAGNTTYVIERFTRLCGPTRL